MPSQNSGGGWDFSFTVDVSVKAQVKITKLTVAEFAIVVAHWDT